MKTNILVNNTNMKQYIKYLCAVVLMLGMSISAWGAVIDKTNYTISTDDIDFGNLDASTPAYVAAGVIETYQEVTITLKKNVNTYVYFVASPDDYYITGYSDASTFFVGSATGSYTIRVYTYFELDNGTHTHTLYFYMGAESEEISVTGTVINACTPNDVAYDHSGTGGNDPTGDATACEDATVSFTPDPSTGYEYSGATVYLSDMETVHASLNSSTTSFTMPNEDVYVVATYAPIDYTISFNANGGSSTMESVERAYNSTYELPACTFTAPAGKVFKCWAEGSAEGTERAVGYSHTVAGDITFYAKWRDGSYTDYVFSCAELTLTKVGVDTMFITSTASKSVRSQEAFHLTGSGLTPSTNFTFSFGNSDLNSRFAFKLADGTTNVSTDASGAIDADIYVVYTPASGDTDDGLDIATNLTVTMSGVKPKTAVLNTKTIIGRHLPTNFVIAAKKNGKWWVLPSDMTTSNPSPVEIAVDDADDPSIAYTATTNIYSIAQPAVSEYIRLKMNGQSNYPLFGSATGSTSIGKSSQSNPDATPILDGYLWKLVQKRATGLSNPQEAKYLIYCKNHSSNHLRLKENAGNPIWGLYDSGIEELRLIPALENTVVEAYFIEYSAAGGVIEVDANTISATKVQAQFNGNTSGKIDLEQTKTSVKNRASVYNYTVTFNGGVNFAASDAFGKTLMLKWYNSSNEMVGVTSIEIPKIIATSATMSSINSGDKPWLQMEVHVLPGVTLTANAGDFASNDVTIKHLEIYPGATVVVTKGDAASGILTATTLVLRNGWSRAGEKTYDVARLYVTPSTATLKASNVYADWYIDYDQYYPIAVPWNATVANFTYRYCSVSPTVGHDKNIRMRYYDGNSRATNIQQGVGDGANWKLYGDAGCASVPATLTPSTGYAMTAKRPSGKAFSIIRMPLTLPSGTWGEGSWTTNGEQGTIGEAPSDEHKDQVAVTAYGVKQDSETHYAEGWNLIANPYMSLHQGALTYNDGSDDEIQYANVPDINFKEYDQLPIETTKLKPASAFLVQVPKTGTVTFGTANRKASAPSYRTQEAPKASKQKAYILLSDEEANDMMGILVSDKYTADYEINADLEKLLGDGTSLRTYMRYGDRNMAYVAINEMLAKEWIPVTVRIPAAGEYTFSLHEASKISELEGIYLIDYESNTVTNLIEDNYSFVAAGGTIADRFAINVIVGKHNTPTDIDIINAGGDINSKKPVKFIWDDKVFILHNGVIYDSTGKRVREINK